MKIVDQQFMITFYWNQITQDYFSKIFYIRENKTIVYLWSKIMFRLSIKSGAFLSQKYLAHKTKYKSLKDNYKKGHFRDSTTRYII